MLLPLRSIESCGEKEDGRHGYRAMLISGWTTDGGPLLPTTLKHGSVGGGGWTDQSDRCDPMAPAPSGVVLMLAALGFPSLVR